MYVYCPFQTYPISNNIMAYVHTDMCLYASVHLFDWKVHARMYLHMNACMHMHMSFVHVCVCTRVIRHECVHMCLKTSMR